MPWFKVDDGLPFHRKVVAAGNPAMGLWVRAGAWCAHELTNGFVPEHMISTMGTPTQAARLVRVGLWIKVEGGYLFHEWNAPSRQPTRDAVLAERARAAARQARLRERRAATQDSLATLTTEKILSESDEEGSEDNGPFPESSQVNGARHGVTPPLLTGEVTGGVRMPRPVPLKEEQESSPNAAALGAPASTPQGVRADLEARFDEFWAAYPRKIQKQDALKAWREVRRKRVEPERIIVGARRYARLKAGEDPKFVRHPASWLRAGGYDDEPEAARLRPAASTADPEAAFAELRAKADARTAARLAGLPFVNDVSPPPDFRGDPYAWEREHRRTWLDQHKPEIIGALRRGERA